MERIRNITDSLTDPEAAALLSAAARAALAGGRVIKELFDQPHTIKMKGEIDLVTEADPASEAEIIKILGREFPGIPALAEESADKNPRQAEGKVWVIDPLDGTTNYAHGFPVFCVSVALMDQGASRVGVIYCPLPDELFCAVKGGGAWLNGKRIRVTDTEQPIKALVATGFPYSIHEYLDTVLNQLRNILPAVRDVRRAGAAAVDLAHTACGRLDGFWELDLKPWDTAAGWLLVEEAGGRVTDFSGGPYSPFKREILATNGKLHDFLVSRLQ